MSDDKRNAILEALYAIRDTAPYTPAISIAGRLDISEGELQAARLGQDVITLPHSPQDIAARLHALGQVKALTRSTLAVLEQKGEYPSLSGGGQAGLLLDPGGLDLRLIFAHWHWCCLIRDSLPDGERLSLQVFDQHGRAVHKAFRLEGDSTSAWQALWQEGNHHPPCFTGEQLPQSTSSPTSPPQGLAEEWAGLTDVHQFFGLLRRHKLSRRDANALMEGHFTRALTKHSIEHLLERAAATAQSLMLFVASPGCVQIRTGCIPVPERKRGWLNLFAEDATLHLDDANIAQTWAVFKPNRDGGATSLEAFDANGELVLQIFSERREGSPESTAWRNLLDTLSHRESAA
uniref:ChuX/HutX family heme-like substrate-binding protein n=1 Tax=Halomonas sp. TaxID=1486246 RepID=UPI002637B528|nr:ChuX/HutX family heme-like substrate-binding protein [Halomonas sp.]